MATLFQSFDFTDILIRGMLSLLLFAGAIHININDLKEQKAPVIVFSILSVIISTFITSVTSYYLLNILLSTLDLHLEIPYIYCLLFGVLISPTYPIAVLSILKEAKVSKSRETKVAGESLFNDGIAVVLNLTQSETIDLSFSNIAWLFVKEAIGSSMVAHLIHFSEPLMMVVAGLVIGEKIPNTPQKVEFIKKMEKFKSDDFYTELLKSERDKKTKG